MKAPEFIERLVQEARELFGVGGPEWRVIVRMSDKPGGKSETTAVTLTTYNYMESILEFNSTSEDDHDSREVAYHEVLHIAHGFVDEAVESIIQQIDEDRREFFRGYYKDEMEKFVTRISRSVAYGLRAKKDV